MEERLEQRHLAPLRGLGARIVPERERPAQRGRARRRILEAQVRKGADQHRMLPPAPGEAEVEAARAGPDDELQPGVPGVGEGCPRRPFGQGHAQQRRLGKTHDGPSITVTYATRNRIDGLPEAGRTINNLD